MAKNAMKATPALENELKALMSKPEVERFTSKTGRDYVDMLVTLSDGTRLWVKAEAKAYAIEKAQAKAAVAPTVRKAAKTQEIAPAAASPAPAFDKDALLLAMAKKMGLI